MPSDPDAMSERVKRIRAYIKDTLDNEHLSGGALGNLYSARDEADLILDALPMGLDREGLAGALEQARNVANRFAAKGWGGIASTLFRITSDEAAAVVKVVEALSALPEAGPAEVGWRPIETCPSDGALILAFGGSRTKVQVECADGDWWRGGCPDDTAPTHWRPLPPPPLDRAGGGAVEGEG